MNPEGWLLKRRYTQDTCSKEDKVIDPSHDVIIALTEDNNKSHANRAARRGRVVTEFVRSKVSPISEVIIKHRLSHLCIDTLVHVISTSEVSHLISRPITVSAFLWLQMNDDGFLRYKTPTSPMNNTK